MGSVVVIFNFLKAEAEEGGGGQVWQITAHLLPVFSPKRQTPAFAWSNEIALWM